MKKIINKKGNIITSDDIEKMVNDLPKINGADELSMTLSNAQGIGFWKWEKEDIIETNQSQIGYLITKYLKRGCAIHLNSEARESAKNLGAHYKLVGDTLYIDIIDMNNEEEIAAAFNKEEIITYLKEKDAEEKKIWAMGNKGSVVSGSYKSMPLKELFLTRLYDGYYSKRRGGSYKILDEDEQ